MSNFEKRFNEYVPKKSCKSCAHYYNGDREMDKCLKIECDDRCIDEVICMDDIENFYDMGREDVEKELKAIHEAECNKIRADAIHEYISWLQDTSKIDMVVWKMLDDYADEFLKEQTNG